MSENRARMLDEDDWQGYRDIRLQALRESPDSFVATFEEERQYDEQAWREHIRRARRFVAESDGTTVGVVSLRLYDEDPEVGEVFGLWVATPARGRRVAWGLVNSAAEQALRDGRTRLYFWVGSGNGPAVAFASSFGFRPTSERRVTGGVQEAALVMPLTSDPTSVRNPRLP